MLPTRKRLWLALSLMTSLFLMPCSVGAYAEEVHFNLTYVLCRFAGLSDFDALWVADADQSMDTNGQTSAFLNAPYWLAHRDRSYFNGAYFHDFSDIAKVAGTDQAPYFADFGTPKTIRYTDNGKGARIGIRISPFCFSGNAFRFMRSVNVPRLQPISRWDNIFTRSKTIFRTDSSRRIILFPATATQILSPWNSFIPYGPYAGHAKRR